MDKIFDLSQKQALALTLVYLIHDDQILLIKRSPEKDMVADEWLGLGGKVEPGETLEASARREFQEETCLTLKNIQLRGSFTWTNKTKYIRTLYIFTADKFSGNLQKNHREGKLQWHSIDQLETLTGLAAHQKLFLPKILDGQNNFYTGIAAYNGDELIAYADNEKYFKTS